MLDFLFGIARAGRRLWSEQAEFDFLIRAGEVREHAVHVEADPQRH